MERRRSASGSAHGNEPARGGSTEASGRAAYRVAKQASGIAALVVVPAFLAVSSSTLKDLIGRYFEDCNVIMEAGEVEPYTDRQGVYRGVYRTSYRLHVFGDTNGHARLHLKTRNCRIEHVSFDTSSFDEALFRHPDDPTHCSLRRNTGSRYSLCQPPIDPYPGKLVEEDGSLRRSEGEGATGGGEAVNSAVREASLLIKDFTPFYEYRIHVTYSQVKQLPCTDLVAYFRPDPAVRSPLAPDPTDEPEDIGEHFKCRVEKASWVNYYARATQVVKVLLIVLVSVPLVYLVSRLRGATT